MKFGLFFMVWLISAPSFSATLLAKQTLSRVATGWSHEGLYLTAQEGLLAEGCTVASAKVENTNPYFDEILSIALSALHTGTQVQFYVDDGCTADNRMILKAISIHK